MAYLVNFEANRSNDNVFIVKELCVCNEAGLTCSWVFTSPFVPDELRPTAERQNAWIWRRKHRIPWNTGTEAYEVLPLVLAASIPIDAHIYTKGSEKATFLCGTLGRPVLDLDHVGCPKLDTLPELVQPLRLVPSRICTSAHRIVR